MTRRPRGPLVVLPSETPETDVWRGLTELERWVDIVGDRAQAPDLRSDERDRLRHLQDDLASHALAARVLITSGASVDSIRPVLRRAAVLLDQVCSHESEADVDRGPVSATRG